MGPITLEARKWAFDEIIKIQSEINALANIQGMPEVYLINDAEAIRIQELWKKNTWPNGWDGNEKRADEKFVQRNSDGTTVLDLFLTESDLSI